MQPGTPTQQYSSVLYCTVVYCIALYRYNFPDMVELLLTQPGVNVNNTDINNLTPLVMACAKGWLPKKEKSLNFSS